MYHLLEEANNMKGIQDLTGCGKPCHYNQYKFVDKMEIFSNPNYDGSCSIVVWAISPDTRVETEELIYPWTSLVTQVMTLLMSPLHFQVAEFGGTLSLFMGFSFMTIWDWGRVVCGRIMVLKGAVQIKAKLPFKEQPRSHCHR